MRVKSGRERNSRLPLSRYRIAQYVGRPAGLACRPQNGCPGPAVLPLKPPAADAVACADAAAATLPPEKMSAVAAESP